MLTEVKTELIASYPTVVDLGSHIRRIIAPFRRFGSGVNVQQVNRPEERIAILFEEEGYALDLNWERLAFIGMSERGNYRNENGPLRFFFQILEKLREEVDTFPGVDALTLHTYDVLGSSKGTDAQSFRSTFLSDAVPGLSDTLNDLAVQLVYESANVTFGPFRPEKDIQRHNLAVLNNLVNNRAFKLMNLEGVLINVEASERDATGAGHPAYIDLLGCREEVIESLRSEL